ncbi:MAG: transcriptional regulatory protein cutR [Candidatus Peregrinibacteria bacterium GW2011_GWF2_33_10]|nr:MAG: transcriptional regulatory protein cutR [Candidatus Peregrinibacteria bacterium GW2011_GWF2_33_10]OGJ45069.1 MAG: hypothetical protein A2263_02440 [Candidatus Peregrinibacteria bacterium RIFOXYA2_FULL_33_21]OGJ46062.1 MAG: hypothetical protein A2272_02085 [Candidatus Peregrinibacteria bacterium RIFOXYA12_FULL_33_12]OGJ50847.1 MAG: hypothetical protein A2307_00615 [Candidatus Peregrinibacteria bacterium RIFOXYB2_FULL_33_20]
MNAILVSTDFIFSRNIKEKLKSENIHLITVSYISNLHVLFLYKKIDIVLIDSQISQDELYETHILLNHYPELKVLVLHRSTLRIKKTPESDHLSYCFLVPNFHFENLGPLLRWCVKETKHEKSQDVLTFADLTLNRKQHIVKRGNKMIYLRKKEFYLLEYLLMHPNIAIQRTNILNHIWDSNTAIVYNTIDSHINNIRKKINIENKPNLIHTIRGIGYKLGSHD